MAHEHLHRLIDDTACIIVLSRLVYWVWWLFQKKTLSRLRAYRYVAGGKWAYVPGIGWNQADAQGYHSGAGWGVPHDLPSITKREDYTQ